MPGYSSTIPGALTYLAQLWSAAIANGGVAIAGETPEVIQGQQLADTSARTALYVGWTGWADTASQIDPTGVEIRSQRSGPAGPDQESYTIHCAAQVLDGGSDMAAAVAGAFVLRDLAMGEVASHRNLGGAQATAQGAAGSLRQEQTTNGNGALATLLFDVEVEAFTNR